MPIFLEYLQNASDFPGHIHQKFPKIAKGQWDPALWGRTSVGHNALGQEVSGARRWGVCGHWGKILGAACTGADGLWGTVHWDRRSVGHDVVGHSVTGAKSLGQKVMGLDVLGQDDGHLQTLHQASFLLSCSTELSLQQPKYLIFTTILAFYIYYNKYNFNEQFYWTIPATSTISDQQCYTTLTTTSNLSDK